MKRSTLPSRLPPVCSHARYASLRRNLSTSTQLLAADSNNNDSSSQDVMRAINSVARDNSSAGARRGNAGFSQPPMGNRPMGSGGNILSVKSLQRGLNRTQGDDARGGGFQGRGGFLGRGGFQGRGAFAGRGGFPGRGAFRGRGGMRERGGFPGRGGMRGRARGRGRGDGRGGGESGESGGQRKQEKDDGFHPEEIMDEAEREFDHAVRFGMTTTYQPSLTLESLVAYVPAAPSSLSVNRRATVMQNLATLGMSDPVGQSLGQPGQYAAEHLRGVRGARGAGLHFFANVEEREWAEESLREWVEENLRPHLASRLRAAGLQRVGPFIRSADENIRSAIVDKAVLGKYERPQIALDPIGMARSVALRSESYSEDDVNRLRDKLASIVKRPRPGRGKAAAAAPRASGSARHQDSAGP